MKFRVSMLQGGMRYLTETSSFLVFLNSCNVAHHGLKALSMKDKAQACSLDNSRDGIMLCRADVLQAPLRCQTPRPHLRRPLQCPAPPASDLVPTNPCADSTHCLHAEELGPVICHTVMLLQMHKRTSGAATTVHLLTRTACMILTRRFLPLW